MLTFDRILMVFLPLLYLVSLFLRQKLCAFVSVVLFQLIKIANQFWSNCEAVTRLSILLVFRKKVCMQDLCSLFWFSLTILIILSLILFSLISTGSQKGATRKLF